MTHLFHPEIVSLPVTGIEETFPVSRIFCVGRNYASHAREMGDITGREAPFFFSKFADTLVMSPATLPYPSATADLHHEIELVLAIDESGTDIPVNEAGEFIFGYAVGLDLTRRDLQQQAKDKRRPWTLSKSFDNAAPITEITPRSALENLESAAIWLDCNGERRQSGHLGEMIWSPAEIIAELSRYCRLNPGDLIFTGTPAGVGPVNRGDKLEGGIEGLPRLQVNFR